MQPTFLCNKHSTWVYNHPNIAIHHLAKNELEGEMQAASGMFEYAIPYYGCALDIAIILYNLSEPDNQGLRQKIATITLALYRLYELAELNEHQRGILQRAFIKLFPDEQKSLFCLGSQDLIECFFAEAKLHITTRSRPSLH